MSATAGGAGPPTGGPDPREARWARLQAAMHAARLDALLVSNIANFRYLTGHAPPIAVAPTRPWYAVLPLAGAPIAIVPDLGRADFQLDGRCARLESWPSPAIGRPEGVDLVAAAIRGLPRRFGRVGAELGPETRLGTTSDDMRVLVCALAGMEIVDAARLIWDVRAAKDADEIARISAAAAAAQAAYDGLPDLLAEPAARTERGLHRRFQQACLAAGADAVPYLAIGSGPGGYDSLTRGPIDRALGPGDVVGLDTGVVSGGAWSDFNRNVAIGAASDAVRALHRRLHRATEAGMAALRPGTRACDVWRAVAAALEVPASAIGRFGHGVGLDYTEPPSIHPDDETPLRAGMVVAVEPSLGFTRPDGRPALLVLEELCLIEPNGARLLSRREEAEIVVVS
ncbi:M24 family metallopeptidase [Salinarimonas sp.]|uniref:M24 family metallopeptidase n=1 Tax=Salinarimonas sp. TaxID=2766526 RepID=UPI0032D8E23B